LLGYGLYQAGQLDEAMDALNRALAVNPYDAETWNLLGLARFRSGRVAEARDAYARALALNGRHAAALNNAGYLDYQAGDYDKAEALFRRALSADPELVEARYHLGLSLLAREQFSQASLQFREVVTQQPTMARAWNALGMAAYAEGNRKAAENHFLRALRIDPSLEQYIVNLGRLRLAGDQAASAARLLGAHVQSYPQHAQACHVYALALAQSEQWADALAEWDQLFARVNNQPFWLLEAAALIGEHASAQEKDLAAARGYLRQAAAILGEQHDAVQAGWQRLRDAR
jgi:Flp pilus assembly protein TadD